MPPLPSPDNLIASLLTALLSASPSSSSNPLKDSPLSSKSILITLHVLFPNELLPALDLLDRRLVTRFRVKDTSDSAEPEKPRDEGTTTSLTAREHKTPSIYFVHSAQASSKRFASQITTHYEVRPQAWNCSCPAFAISAFPAEHSEASDHSPTLSTNIQTQSHSANTLEEWHFGGMSLDTSAPVCKHLLACVFAERCPGIFGGVVEEKVVSEEELAGWCAGWGG